MKTNAVCLIRISGPAGNASVVGVESARFTIGRVGADFIVHDKGVSRVHLTVHVRGREIWLEDMGSANGTFIDNNRIEGMKAIQYKLGSRVRLGLAGDIYSFELADKIATQDAAAEAEALLDKFPSRALQTAPPTVELAAQADQFLREARETATGIKEASSREAEMIVNNARKKANDALAEARAEAIALIEKARNSASQATLDREAAAENALKSARREAIEIKSRTDEEVEKMNKEARVAAAQVKLQAQTEAENILQIARKRAAEFENEAEEEARELLKQSREKARLLREANEAEVAEAISNARKAAAGIRAEADTQLEKARAYVAEKGATLLKESEHQAAKIVLEAEEEARLTLEGAAQESQRAVNLALKEAHEDVTRIRADAAAEIKRLQEQQTRLEFEVDGIEKRKRDLQAETEVVIRDLKYSTDVTVKELKAKVDIAQSENLDANKQLGETRLALEAIEGELARAQSNLALSMTMKENADKAAKDLREEREKNLMEFEDRKKQQQSEIATLKLKYFEDMKERELEEQARQRTIRGHQVAEMTRHIEMVLVPLVQKQLSGSDATNAVTELKEALGPVVRRVIFEEQSVTGASDLEQVISSDPIIEKYKKRQRLRSRAMLAIPTLAFATAVFAPNVFEFARDPVRIILAGGRTEDQIKAERSYRSIASKRQFNPTLVAQAGETYADSVLFTRDYVTKKLDAKNQKRWAVELESFMFNELGLPESIAVSYLAVETRLIKELQGQRAGINAENPELEKAGIQRIRDVEQSTLPELKGKVGGDIAYERIRAFEKKFFESL